MTLKILDFLNHFYNMGYSTRRERNRHHDSFNMFLFHECIFPTDEKNERREVLSLQLL